MFDLRRLGGVLIAAALLVPCLAITEGFLASTTRWWPAWARSDWEAWRFEFLEGVGPRLASQADGRSGDVRPLGLLIGSSSIRHIDSGLLERCSSGQLRWLVLTGPVAGPLEMKEALRLALGGGLRPARLVVAMELLQLARWTPYYHFYFTQDSAFHPGSRIRRLLSEVRRARPEALSSLEDLTGYIVTAGFNRCFPARTRIHQRLCGGLMRSRIACLESMGQDVRAAFAPDGPRPAGEPAGRKDGGRAPLPPPTIDPRSGGDRADGREYHYLLGAFDPANYAIDRETYRALVELVRMARAAGADVSVVVMPLPSDTRRDIPAIALPNLHRVLRDDLGTAAPAIIDLYEYLPDDQFYDYLHSTPAGSDRLAAEIVRRLEIEPRG